VVGCKVLPIFNENGIVDGAVKKIVHRLDGKKAVARVKELLRWASQVRPLSTSASGKKWKVNIMRSSCFSKFWTLYIFF
jgi:hypothetical protein